MLEKWHGTNSGYSGHGCRCDPCKAAHASAIAEQRRARSQRLDEATHGLLSTYINWRCRCKLCRAANAEHMNDYLKRKKNRLA